MSHGTIAHENSKEHKVKKKLLQAVFVVCSLGLGTQTATAGGVSLELLGNGTYSMATGTPTPTSGLAFPGGGLNINLHLGPKLAFQVGGHYVSRLLTTTAAFTNTFISTNAGLKFMLSPAFSLILGGYYNSSMTDNIGLLYTDLGASVGFGLAIPMGSSVSFYISPMYHYALNQQNYITDNSMTLTPSELIGFVGFVFGGGSK